MSITLILNIWITYTCITHNWTSTTWLNFCIISRSTTPIHCMPAIKLMSHLMSYVINIKRIPYRIIWTSICSAFVKITLRIWRAHTSQTPCATSACIVIIMTNIIIFNTNNIIYCYSSCSIKFILPWVSWGV